MDVTSVGETERLSQWQLMGECVGRMIKRRRRDYLPILRLLDINSVAGVVTASANCLEENWFHCQCRVCVHESWVRWRLGGVKI